MEGRVVEPVGEDGIAVAEAWERWQTLARFSAVATRFELIVDGFRLPVLADKPPSSATWEPIDVPGPDAGSGGFVEPNS